MADYVYGKDGAYYYVRNRKNRKRVVDVYKTFSGYLHRFVDFIETGRGQNHFENQGGFSVQEQCICDLVLELLKEKKKKIR